jgi:Flp pilus assembly pilin Flp
MQLLLTAVRDFGRADQGQDLIEYGLLIALISIFAVGAVANLGNVIHTVFWQTIVTNF